MTLGKCKVTGTSRTSIIYSKFWISTICDSYNWEIIVVAFVNSSSMIAFLEKKIKFNEKS